MRTLRGGTRQGRGGRTTPSPASVSPARVCAHGREGSVHLRVCARPKLHEYTTMCRHKCVCACYRSTRAHMLHKHVCAQHRYAHITQAYTCTYVAQAYMYTCTRVHTPYTSTRMHTCCTSLCTPQQPTGQGHRVPARAPTTAKEPPGDLGKPRQTQVPRLTRDLNCALLEGADDGAVLPAQQRAAPALRHLLF